MSRARRAAVGGRARRVNAPLFIFFYLFFFSPVWERDREGKMVRMKGHRLLRPPPLMAKQTETQCQRAGVASAGGKSGA